MANWAGLNDEIQKYYLTIWLRACGLVAFPRACLAREHLALAFLRQARGFPNPTK